MSSRGSGSVLMAYPLRPSSRLGAPARPAFVLFRSPISLVILYLKTECLVCFIHEMKYVKTFSGMLGISLLVSTPSIAVDRYMRPVNAGTAHPFTSWATAATNFSQFAAVWQDGDVIWLTNGLYQSNYSIATLDKGVTIKTAGSREGTIVDGAGWKRFSLQHADAVLEGFTITNCYHQYGGAVDVYLGGTIRNCTLVGNRADNGGGAIYLDQGGVVEGCLLAANQANSGGAIYCGYGGMVMNSTVTLSRASGGGGGIYMNRGGIVSNCVISGNKAGPAGDGGGGVLTYYGGEVYDSVITSNSASYNSSECRGGGVSLYYYGIVSNCTITGNTITYNGGGVAIYQCSSGGVYHCSISNNAATNAYSGRGGGVWCSGGGAISDCEILDNDATAYGGGVWYNAAGCVVSNSLIQGNYALMEGGGLFFSQNERLFNSMVRSNSAGRGGGISVASGSTISSSEFRGNLAFGTETGAGGGGLYGAGPFYVTNCLFASNIASNTGGGVNMFFMNGRFYYCTIAGNTASNAGGIFRSATGAALENCIVFNNYASTVNSNYLLSGTGSTNSFCTYSCTAPSLTGTGLTGNLYVDPRFKDPAGGDYELGTNSPCIDTASALAVPFDLKGVRRPLDGNGDGTNTCDMGAYEFAGRFSDSDGDGMNDQSEIRIGTDPLSKNTDGDSADDNFEYITGSNPRSYTGPSELFHAKLGPVGGGLVVVNWDSVTGRFYSVLGTTNLLSAESWYDTSFTNIAGTGGSMSYTNTTTAESEFMTLKVTLPEEP